MRHGLPCRLLEAAGGDRIADLDPYERGLRLGLRQMAAVTDIRLLDVLGHRVDVEKSVALRDLGEGNQTRLLLAYSVLWGKVRPGNGGLNAVDAFTVSHPELRRDLSEVIAYQRQRTVPASEVFFPDHTGVLELHACYTREQILLALGKGTFEVPFAHREGVLYLPERKIDAFFVTINKAESEFSPTTMYEDYAITDSLFHWQSQSGVGPDSVTGQRYMRHREKGYVPMLFVRLAKRLESGLTAPFFFCGPLSYVRHEGGHPMSIVWRLEYPLTAKVFRFSHRDAA